MSLYSPSGDAVDNLCLYGFNIQTVFGKSGCFTSRWLQVNIFDSTSRLDGYEDKMDSEPLSVLQNTVDELTDWCKLWRAHDVEYIGTLDEIEEWGYEVHALMKFAKQ